MAVQLSLMDKEDKKQKDQNKTNQRYYSVFLYIISTTEKKFLKYFLFAR